MKSNQELQTDIQNPIKRKLLFSSAKIGVTTKDDGVDSYAKKLEAENVAKKRIGVKALVERIC